MIFHTFLQGCTSMQEHLMRTEPSPMMIGMLFAPLLDHKQTHE